MASITFKQLEAFVAVAELGSFRRAATRLNTTQPNISIRIARLEEQLRLTLMERDAGSVRLTPRGQDMLDRARAVLAETDAFLAAAGDDTLFEGVLRLGVVEVVAHTWLRPFLKAMKTRFPAVDIELTVDLSDTLSTQLFDRNLDLTFQNAPFDRTAAATIPLSASPYTWVASPEIPSALPDQAGVAILTHARGTTPYRQLETHFAGRGRLVPSSNIAACLQMTVDGLGLACLPEAMAAPYLADGRLVRVAYPWTPDELRFAARHLVDPPPSYMTAAIEIAAKLSHEDKKSLS